MISVTFLSIYTTVGAALCGALFLAAVALAELGNDD